MINASLQNSIDSLQLEDVYVRNFSVDCAEDFIPKYDPDVHALNTEWLNVPKSYRVVELEDTTVLLVFVLFGARWVTTDEAVRATIEAEFIAEYRMRAPLEESYMQQFVVEHASDHVWPYWRELLNSQCGRSHFPKFLFFDGDFNNRAEQVMTD